MRNGFPVLSRRAFRLVLIVTGIALLCWPSFASAQTPRQELRRVKQQIAQELRSRPEVLQARQDWIDLRLEYQALRRAVVAELSADSVYLAERAKLWATEDELAALADHYRNGVIPADRVQELSKRILEIRLVLGRMEQAVLKKHQGAEDARKAYIAAARRLLELNREMKDLLRSDPRFQEALARFQASQGGGNQIRP
jgi:hypothetical protein